MQRDQEALRTEIINMSREAAQERETLYQVIYGIRQNSAEYSIPPPLSQGSHVSGTPSTGSPFPREPRPVSETQQGTRSHPFVITQSTSLPSTTSTMSVTEELLLARERQTWTSHTIPTGEFLFLPEERETLRRLPEYAFLKDDQEAPLLKRAIRFIAEEALAFSNTSSSEYMRKLARDFAVTSRSITFSQAAELMTLGQITDPTASTVCAIVEFAILANPIFPAHVFDRIRVARITRPTSRQEVEGWARGQLAETRLPNFLVKAQPHQQRSGSKRARTPARNGNDKSPTMTPTSTGAKSHF